MTLSPKTLDRLKYLYPDYRNRVIATAMAMSDFSGKRMICVQGLRTFLEQSQDFAKGRGVPGKKVTNAPPGLSTHHYGVGTDWAFEGKDPYLTELFESERVALFTTFGKLAQKRGLTWGGDWHGDGVRRVGEPVDMPHLEMRYGGMRAQDMYAEFKKSGIKGLWLRFDNLRNVPPMSEWTDADLPPALTFQV